MAEADQEKLILEWCGHLSGQWGDDGERTASTGWSGAAWERGSDATGRSRRGDQTLTLRCDLHCAANSATFCVRCAVPRWVDEKSYNNCKSCAAKMDGFLTKKDKHHCRLCGQMFCSACTQKYNLPLIYRVKNKDGPARVCMSCVDGCLAEKAKVRATRTPHTRPTDWPQQQIQIRAPPSHSLTLTASSAPLCWRPVPPRPVRSCLRECRRPLLWLVRCRSPSWARAR